MARQQKIQLFGKFRPTGIDQTAGAKFAQIASIASDISRTAMGVAEERAIEQGRVEGATMGTRVTEEDIKQGKTEEGAQVGDLKAPELTMGLTSRGKARNQAAITAYKAEVARDAKLNFDRIARESKSPEEFKKSMDGYLAGLTKGIDPIIAAEINPIVAEYSAAAQGRYEREEWERGQEVIKASLVESEQDFTDQVLNAARNGDTDALTEASAQLEQVYRSSVDAGFISKAQMKQQVEKLKEQVFIQTRIGEAQKIINTPLTPEEREQELQKVFSTIDKKGIDLDPNQKDGLVKSINSLVRAKELEDNEQIAEQRKAIAIEVSDLKINASSGRGDPAEIEAQAFDLFQKNLITESELHSIRSSIESGQQRRSQIAEINDKVSRKLSGDESIILDQKEVDTYYEANVEPAIQELNREQRGAILANFVKATKVVPKGLKQRISQYSMSQSPDLVIEGATLMEGLESIPGVQSAFTAQERAFLTKVAKLSSALDPEEALKLARENTDPRRAGMVETAQIAIKEFEKDNKDFYQDKVQDFGEVDPITAGRLSQEYKLLFQEHIKAGASIDEAEEIADRLINQNWGYSPSLKKFTKHPPENFYGVTGSDGKYIMRQLSKEVNELVWTKEGIKNDDIILIPDVTTEKEASMGAPSYLIQIRDEYGAIKPVFSENGKALRFRPDKAEEIKRIKNKNKEKYNQLRESASSQKAPKFFTDKGPGLL